MHVMTIKVNRSSQILTRSLKFRKIYVHIILPLDYTWQIVRDRVQQFGETESVDMIAPGVARVRFALIQDAERMRGALTGTSVEGRTISVEYMH
ncbi:hypothetical protein OESDEN_02311 [Oesophagostomum dentatum]|uniref:RRM domain-containing protein n=1 Tax=Oesophagostomum dentatum TaxID=61180 RepID=A0A0B1TJK4_OESDE|nr:hypothetical protein OESDEN_02311 [Oesophagostomum dentatum]